MCEAVHDAQLEGRPLGGGQAGESGIELKKVDTLLNLPGRVMPSASLNSTHLAFSLVSRETTRTMEIR